MGSKLNIVDAPGSQDNEEEGGQEDVQNLIGLEDELYDDAELSFTSRLQKRNPESASFSLSCQAIHSALTQSPQVIIELAPFKRSHHQDQTLGILATGHPLCL